MISNLEGIKFNKKGLIPAILQDVTTSSVLMLAYMNKTALQKTIETGEAWFYSRSRKQLWHKGATSGHYQQVVSIVGDCDGDTLLLKVRPQGPTCHTGHYSCFSEQDEIKNVLNAVYYTIVDRKAHPKQDAYTNYLFREGLDKILKKVGEEASEVIIAAKNSHVDLLAAELCDLIYHSMVLMVEKDITFKQLKDELVYRMG